MWGDITRKIRDYLLHERAVKFETQQDEAYSEIQQT